MADSKSKTKSSTIWTTPNVITMVRICLVPVFVIALLSPWPEWMGFNDFIDNQVKAVVAAVVFIVISGTDWIDGYIARKRNQVTDFGKFLDPLADKILVAAALIALVELQVIPSWPVLIIITREFIVSGIRMVAASKNVVIAASWYGKWKTVLQIIAIVLFLIKDTLVIPDPEAAISNPLYDLSWIVMIAALVMTILSMLDYIAKARHLLFSSEGDSDEDADADDSNVRNDIDELSREVVKLAKRKGITLACAESLTGGMIASSITSVPGSSSVFLGGIVSYAISAKERILGVDASLLEREGAVDPVVAEEMAAGAARQTGADIAIAVTGIAGPSGEEPGKPIGTVYFGLFKGDSASSERQRFSGDRDSVRLQTTEHALESIINSLK